MTSEDGFFNHSQLVADYLAETFAERIRTEYLTFARATPTGQHPACVARARQVEVYGAEPQQATGRSS